MKPAARPWVCRLCRFRNAAGNISCRRSIDGFYCAGKTTVTARPHIRGCKRRTALECPVGGPCFCADPVAVCDVCDPCTCKAEPTPEEWGAILREGLKLWLPIAAFMFVAIIGWFLVKKLPHDRHPDRSRIDSKKNDR